MTVEELQNLSLAPSVVSGDEGDNTFNEDHAEGDGASDAGDPEEEYEEI